MKTQKTQQMQKTQNKHKQGFTLLELLVVTIIIGILAAIALPQYQMVVGKSKYTTLKNITRSIGDAAERSYLANNAYPQSFQELDIEQPADLECYWWRDGQDIAACYKDVANKQMGYYWNFRKHKNHMCYTTSTKENHVTNKICQRETGKANGGCSSGEYCTYFY